MTMRTVLTQPSWRLANTNMEVFVTENGGHLGPATFDRKGKAIQPLSVAPWVMEPTDRKLPKILKVLRGDFFCLPFGGNETPFRGEHHPVHGETANAQWKLESLTKGHLHVSLRTKKRPRQVDKHIYLRDGHNAIYSRHVISGMKGAMNPGHHAMLAFPDTPGSGVISTSPFIYGQVFPGAFETPATGGYQSLIPGAEFSSLEQVPLLSGGMTDLTRYPARRGYEDLVILVGDPGFGPGWTAVTFPDQRYVWFAMKDSRMLRHTVLWLSNGGRHYPPWNGRHVNVMGLEEVTSYFHLGLAESARLNPLSAKGYPTCLTLNPNRETVINYIMAVAAIPRGFDKVAALETSPDQQSVTLRSPSGISVNVPIDCTFIGH